MRAQTRFTFLTVCVFPLRCAPSLSQARASARSNRPGAEDASQGAACGGAREGRMLQITVLKIKSELMTEWLAFQKSETIPMLKKAGIPRRDAWQTRSSAKDRCPRS